ncbi:hypothetical protein X962_5179 [Burkholderia pseudomallei MSHR7343]|nr:hypothetical protein X962_5179 [Burkholderia pseudomallei MSHR7343]
MLALFNGVSRKFLDVYGDVVKNPFFRVYPALLCSIGASEAA